MLAHLDKIPVHKRCEKKKMIIGIETTDVVRKQKAVGYNTAISWLGIPAELRSTTRCNFISLDQILIRFVGEWMFMVHITVFQDAVQSVICFVKSVLQKFFPSLAHNTLLCILLIMTLVLFIVQIKF